MIKAFLILLGSTVFLGGCVTAGAPNPTGASGAIVAANVSKVDVKVADVSAKLYKYCLAAEAAAKLAALYTANKYVALGNQAINTYCQDKPVTSVASAIHEVGNVVTAIQVAQ